MEIKFDFPEGELENIGNILKENLNLSTDISETQFNDKLNELAKTAFYEYINMITDSGIPTKTSDLLQNRILYFIEHYFGRFPTENEIARIFNIPISKSRLILNNLKATHRNILKNKLKTEITSFIRSGVEIDDDKWEFEVKSKPIVQELNDFIALKKPGLETFKQKKGSAGKVILSSDTYDFLKTEFGD